jgi:hypothetical protein
MLLHCNIRSVVGRWFRQPSRLLGMASTPSEPTQDGCRVPEVLGYFIQHYGDGFWRHQHPGINTSCFWKSEIRFKRAGSGSSLQVLGACLNKAQAAIQKPKWLTIRAAPSIKGCSAQIFQMKGLGATLILMHLSWRCVSQMPLRTVACLACASS